jgi:hypothetical protein
MSDEEFAKFSWVSRMHRNDEVSSNDLIAVYAEALRLRARCRVLEEALRTIQQGKTTEDNAHLLGPHFSMIVRFMRVASAALANPPPTTAILLTCTTPIRSGNHFASCGNRLPCAAHAGPPPTTETKP